MNKRSFREQEELLKMLDTFVVDVEQHPT